MIKTYLKYCLIIIFSTFFLCFMWLLLFAPEQYYILDPYCDTIMAKDFTPEKFRKVKPGMTQLQVEQIIGKPLYVDTVDFPDIEKTFVFSYTDDGKLLNQELPWYMYNDYAWYGASVVFDTLMKVQVARDRWVYD